MYEETPQRIETSFSSRDFVERNFDPLLDFVLVYCMPRIERIVSSMVSAVVT